MIRRALILLAALVAAFLLPAGSASATSGWQPEYNTHAAEWSAHVNGAVVVSYGEYLDVTQQNRAACGHVADNGDYVAPAVPASVKADIARDTAPRYFHAVKYGSLTGNGSQTVTYRSNYAGAYSLFVPGAGANGQTVTAYESMTVHRAWVADFRGAGCDVWTEIQTHN